MLGDAIRKALDGKAGVWIQQLIDKAGFDPLQARSFVPAVIAKVKDLAQRGKLDLGGLDLQKLLGRLDASELGRKAGVDPAKADRGLRTILPDMLQELKTRVGSTEGMAQGAKGMIAKLRSKLRL